MLKKLNILLNEKSNDNEFSGVVLIKRGVIINEVCT